MDTKRIIDQSLGVARGVARQATRAGRGTAAQAWGLTQKLRNRPGPKDLDDVTLTRKVESEVFRSRDAPKSSVSVTVVDGIVELRGEVKRPAHVNTIEARVLAIPEVRGVENLLHLPKTPAPTRADAPASQRRSATPKRQGAQARQRKTTKVTDDQTDRVVSESEPTPQELAQEGKGRQPAPLGSDDGESSA